MAPSRLSIISRAGSEYGSLSGAHLLSCIGADSVPIDEAGNGSRSAIKKIVFLRFEIGQLHRLKQTVLKILPFVCRDRRRMEDKPIPRLAPPQYLFMAPMLHVCLAMSRRNGRDGKVCASALV